VISMLSKSAAKTFFIAGTAIASIAFVLLTIDTLKQVPRQTHEENLTESAIRGKHLWDRNNCMGCHTLMGEGGYYAPELTKVFERRGEGFIKAMLKDPEGMYPGQRKMVNYYFKDEEINDLVAFLKWVGEMDLNGYPKKPELSTMADITATASSGPNAVVVSQVDRPLIFNQMCVACHSLGGRGGAVGPALDGVGSRLDKEAIIKRLTDPATVQADAKMPKLPLTKENIVELSAFLSELKAPGVSK
jgi:nitric oxide reductase subunit C